MKIEGIDKIEIDTDKMNDVEAEIFEKMYQLCLLAQKYDVPFFL